MEIKVLQLHKKASIEYKHIQDKYNFSTSKNVLHFQMGQLKVLSLNYGQEC